MSPVAVSRTTRWFLFCEIACLFLYSIWWRKDIPVEVGIAAAAGHLLGLVVLLIDLIVQVDLFRSMRWILQASFVGYCAGLWVVSVRLTRSMRNGDQCKDSSAVGNMLVELRQKA